jgi:hypothetical protein
MDLRESLCSLIVVVVVGHRQLRIDLPTRHRH